ncbi:AraC family transcriptional regulator [Ferruginibacter sp. HRS2-29]|uniref:helix-turn-helix domain-containing protein n=1 Tax=Ferruginibacter sp. HRS2-29 TaxID=2487334 RepID=UPI0020CBC028|nr:helix-turn-helix transcriptional regulator [Ferruginibacter sp. HRS2-29]MCP9751220.1 AraC family transcriptional regulator [Ferruginibacter sp. HRS2-29]
MARIQTLEDFYLQKFQWLPDNLKKDIGHFNVFRVEDCGDRPVEYTRREFYKVALLRGHYIYHYADKSLEVSGTTLIFFNPVVPYTFEKISENATGYFCIFKDAFFTATMRGGIQDLPMFASGNKPSYLLNKKQDKFVSNIFEKMLEEIGSDYVYKYDLIRNYIVEMIHYALKLEPQENIYQHADANSRITAVFTELLERQFPIESPSQRFTLRSARDFAEQLSVHVNHLNRAIRLTTGKTTTDHIFERLTGEACALLKHTNWNISEISYSLGFEEPAHFNHFFKKQTSVTPSTFRE